MSATGPLLLHGSCVCWPEGAALLRGGSGAGKSDLALRLIENGAALVADDQVSVTRDGMILLAAPPPSLAGLLEVSGIGILCFDFSAPARLTLLVDLVEEGEVERMPETLSEELLGIALPLFRLSPWPASAAAKVRLAMKRAAGSIMALS